MAHAVLDPLVVLGSLDCLIKSQLEDLVFGSSLRVDELSSSLIEELSLGEGYNCKSMVDAKLFKLALSLVQQNLNPAMFSCLLEKESNRQQLLNIRFVTNASIPFKIVIEAILSKHTDCLIKVSVQDQTT